MNVARLVANKKTENAQNLAKWRPRVRQLRRDLEDYRRNILTNGHDPYTVEKIQKRIEQAEAEVAELERRIKAINAFAQPTQHQVDLLEGLYTKAYCESLNAGVAESEAQIAEHNERPKAAADARKRQAEHAAEFVKANGQLRKALEKVGLDPTTLCGRV